VKQLIPWFVISISILNQAIFPILQDYEIQHASLNCNRFGEMSARDRGLLDQHNDLYDGIVHCQG
jgi:hypothetical protein